MAVTTKKKWRDRLEYGRTLIGKGFDVYQPGAGKRLEEVMEIPEASARRLASALRRELEGNDDVTFLGHTAADSLPNPEELFVSLEKLTSERVSFVEERYKQVIKVSPKNGPIAIIPSSDWHIGGEYVDYGKLKRDAHIIAETPGMYGLLAGDYHNNWLGALSHLNSNESLGIEEQLSLVDHLIGIMADKLFCCIPGNHDLWTMKAAGFDHIRRLCESERFLYDRDEVFFTLKMGKASWRVIVRHTFPGRSKYNTTHGNAMHRKFVTDHDISIGGHTHDGTCFREEWHMGKPRLDIQLGTYKFFDDYAKNRGYPDATASPCGGVILFDNNEWVTCRSIEKTAELLGLLRANST